MERTTRALPIVACLAACLALGCSGKSRQQAKTATEKFRLRWIRGASGEIYQHAGEEFRASATPEQFDKFVSGVTRRLGAWQSAEEGGWGVNMGTKGTLVSLGYKSQFEKGIAVEEFIWRIAEPEPILVGYKLNSPQLMPD